MKLDRKKFAIARARACMGQKDFEKAEELIAKMIDRTQKGIED